MTNIKTASEAVLFFIVQNIVFEKHTEKRFEVCLRQVKLSGTVKFAMQVKFAYASDEKTAFE